MSYASSADLNAYASVADDYDEISFHSDDPGASLTDYLVAGPYSLSMNGAGVAGPNASQQPATDGRDYSDTVTAVLPSAASWAQIRVGGVARRTFALPRGPIGPGTFPIVYGLAVR